jgi:hypothetical protein
MFGPPPPGRRARPPSGGPTPLSTIRGAHGDLRGRGPAAARGPHPPGRQQERRIALFGGSRARVRAGHVPERPTHPRRGGVPEDRRLPGRGGGVAGAKRGTRRRARGGERLDRSAARAADPRLAPARWAAARALRARAAAASRRRRHRAAPHGHPLPRLRGARRRGAARRDVHDQGQAAPGYDVFLDEPSVTGTENAIMAAVRARGRPSCATRPRSRTCRTSAAC